MKPSEIVSQNLVGLNYFPKPFPDHVWDQEFVNVDIDVFKKAIKRIRSTSSNFPTYSEVRNVMSKIKADEYANTRQTEYDNIPEYKTIDKQRREVFWKWYKWLRSFGNGVLSQETMLEYYEGCAKDYQAIGGDAEYMGYVDELYKKADEKQEIIDSRAEELTP